MMRIEKTELNNLTFRSMDSEDLPAIVSLEKKIFPDPWPRSAFLELFEGDSWYAWVAETDDDTIGYACAMIAANECHLANIAVVEKYRRKSVAKKFLGLILELAKEKECSIILLEVRASNEAAIAFYEKNNFEHLYRRPRYYRHPIEDALVMVHDLSVDRVEK